MMHMIVMIAGVACILGLFALDRDPMERTSKALWIPLLWCLINGSRSVSQWFTGPMNQDAAHYSEGTPADAAIFALLVLAGLLVLNHRSSRVKQFLQSNLPLILFFSYCAISILWSDFPMVAIKRYIKALGDIVMVLVVLTDVSPLQATRKLFSRIAFVLLPLSILLILFLPQLGTYYDPGSGITYYNGVTTQKNSLGQTCLVCGLASLWLLLGALESAQLPRRRMRLLLYGAMLVSAVGLIVRANSMTSLSSFAVASVVMILISQRWLADRVSGVHIVVGGAVCMAVFAVFIESSGELLHSLGRNSTLTGRTDIWRAVLALHTNPLVGTGFESFWLGSRLQFVWDTTAQPGILQAHNGYLETYINLGWVGVVLLGVLIVTGYRNALIAFYRDRAAGRLGLAFFTASLMFSLSEAGFRIMNLIWFAFLLAVTGIPSDAQSGVLPAPVQRPLAQAQPQRRFKVLQ